MTNYGYCVIRWDRAMALFTPQDLERSRGEHDQGATRGSEGDSSGRELRSNVDEAHLDSIGWNYTATVRTTEL